MGANVGWSYGTNHEYRTIATRFNNSTAAERKRFVDAIRTEGLDLMDAHRAAFPAAPGDTDTDQWRNAFAQIHANWFGDRPMWYGNSTLTPGQIHEIVRESRARTVELLLAGAGPVSIYIACGYPTFSTVITWDGAHPSDAHLTPDGKGWTPNNATGPVVVWVRTPFNSGYATNPTPEMIAEGHADLQKLIDQVTAHLVAHGITGTGPFTPQQEHVRQNALSTISNLTLVEISEKLPRGELPFRNTVLGAYGDGNSRPGRKDLTSEFSADLHTPPQVAYGIPADYPSPPDVVLPAPRTGPGITIGWKD